jgi:type I restriction enzyme S subunit
MLRVNNFRGYGLDTSDVMRIASDVEAKYSRTRIRTHDVLITVVGSVGQVAVVPEELTGWNLARAVALLRPRERELAKWIALCLRSPTAQHALGMSANTTVQTTINLKDLRKLELPMPPAAERAAIEEVLSALDDRIDLLRQTNATLESIAQALFKSWFIDFDPVRAKAEGGEPEGMDAATAALFPAEFVESALGMIPKGWLVVTVADMCSRVSNGGTPSRAKPEFWTDGSVPWFKTGELFDAHLLHPTERITSEAVAKTSVKVLPRHAVLMAIYAAPTVGRLGILTEEAAFNQACTGMVARPDIGTWFLFQTLHHGRDWFNSRANGAAQQNISKGIVESYQCVQPAVEVLRKFDELASELYASAERNARQAQVLAELRDALLPRLISGKLRLPEAQDRVEDAIA